MRCVIQGSLVKAYNVLHTKITALLGAWLRFWLLAFCWPLFYSDTYLWDG